MKTIIIRVEPDFKAFMNIKLTTSRLLQILLTVAQVGNLLAPIIPPKFKPIAAAVMGAVQVFINELSGNSNPDGTPATQPYVPPVAPPPVNGAPH